MLSDEYKLRSKVLCTEEKTENFKMLFCTKLLACTAVVENPSFCHPASFSTPTAINFTWRADIYLAIVCEPTKDGCRPKARDLHLRRGLSTDSWDPRFVLSRGGILSRNSFATKLHIKGRPKKNNKWMEHNKEAAPGKKNCSHPRKTYLKLLFAEFSFFFHRELPALWRISFYFYDACIIWSIVLWSTR